MKKTTFLLLLLFSVYSWKGEAQTICSQTQPSNGFENGLYIEQGGQKMADDFILSAGTFDFAVTSIKANLLAQGGVASINVLFFTDNAGLPGTQIGATILNLVPTSQPIIGSAFGFDIHEVQLDLPSPVSFSGNANSSTTYWVQLVAIPTVPTTQAGWEATSLNLIGNPSAFDNLSGTWNHTSGPAYDLVFTIEGTCETCFPPTNIVASNLNDDSADISWTAGGTETEWEIKYELTGSQSGGTTVLDSDGTIGETLTGLTSGNFYDVYVRATCSNGYNSSWAGPITFFTPCSAISSFPFEESFEDSSATQLCWINEHVSGTVEWGITNSNQDGSITPLTGSSMANFQSLGYGDITKLISPSMDLTSLTNPELSFYFANVAWQSDLNELRVFYKTSANDSWTQIGSDYVQEQTTWTQVVLSLPNPSTEYYIAFEATSNFGKGVEIDDVKVSESLAIADQTTLEFTYYPNPTSNLLSLKAANEIQQVVVYDLMGREVMNTIPNSATTTLKTANLKTGTYFMKVSINDTTGFYQFMKK